MTKDLTVGRAESVLWRFCLPLFGSVLFQQLYNIADSFVAGKFIGEEALAAVGNSYEITLIYIAFGFGCNIGCSVVTSQFFGAKRLEKMKTTVYTTFIATGALCALLMAAGLLFGGPMLRMIHTPANIFDDSALYLKIYVLGLPFVFFYNVSTGIFSALGDSKTPFFFLAASSVANIGADILFVTAFKMGVAGVAWATFICQGISCILALVVVFSRFNKIKTKEKPELFSFNILGKISMIAVPSILQQSFVSVGNILIQGMINSYGSGVIAGYSAAVKLNNLVITSFTTLGNGVSNFTAQNIGAGKPERVREGFRAGVKLVWAISVPIMVLYFFFGRTLVYLFLDEPTAQALKTGKEFLMILSPFYLAVAAKLVADGILKGCELMGRFMTATFTDLVLRVVLAKLLSMRFGSTGLWTAWPVGWLTATVLSVYFCVSSIRRLIEGRKKPELQ
ncbi:MAG: MATE family efflux transporter [Ruminococcus sp.]|nr:MATE family efflux transporter [Ruminococcus sp.]